ncbi:hypothetical protein TNCV_1441681 [Trichonephila clavipes]|uniref:Uncharacterized protein n=1 Tax=Trichonephila clavipes TaxID=2585209 RepID=A0A8X6V812_TRICX|nr:hypothetical protein TNCV_1441681 [Trichonephila clavipes]
MFGNQFPKGIPEDKPQDSFHNIPRGGKKTPSSLATLEASSPVITTALRLAGPLRNLTRSRDFLVAQANLVRLQLVRIDQRMNYAVSVQTYRERDKLWIPQTNYEIKRRDAGDSSYAPAFIRLKDVKSLGAPANK